MNSSQKPPSQPRYERVRKFLESELYFTSRMKGKPITIVKPGGDLVTYPAEVVGITNYIHANYDDDLLAMPKASITDIAANLIESGDWKKHLPPGGRNGDIKKTKPKVVAKPEPKATKPKPKPKPKPKLKTHEKKSDAPSASPRATEPEVPVSGEAGAGVAIEITAQNHDPTPVAPEAPASENELVEGAAAEVPDDEVDDPPDEAVAVSRSNLRSRPVRRALPQSEWTIPVISLLMGAEQIAALHDNRPGSEKRLSALQGLAEEYEQVIETKSGRGETSSK